jgi:hypothetical protein
LLLILLITFTNIVCSIFIIVSMIFVIVIALVARNSLALRHPRTHSQWYTIIAFHALIALRKPLQQRTKMRLLAQLRA